MGFEQLYPRIHLFLGNVGLCQDRVAHLGNSDGCVLVENDSLSLAPALAQPLGILTVRANVPGLWNLDDDPVVTQSAEVVLKSSSCFRDFFHSLRRSERLINAIEGMGVSLVQQISPLTIVVNDHGVVDLDIVCADFITVTPGVVLGEAVVLRSSRNRRDYAILDSLRAVDCLQGSPTALYHSCSKTLACLDRC